MICAQSMSPPKDSSITFRYAFNPSVVSKLEVAVLAVNEGPYLVALDVPVTADAAYVFVVVSVS